MAAVKILEDDPHFGAGFGSSLNADGHVETDSMIMDGSILGLGAVAGVQGVENQKLSSGIKSVVFIVQTQKRTRKRKKKALFLQESDDFG